MPLAKEVAQELRRLADALDTIPHATVSKPDVYFFPLWANEKDEFLNVAKVFPRPYVKVYEERENGNLELQYETPAIRLITRIRRSSVCRIVEPAKPAVYECEPLLSEEEESTLEHSEVA